MGWLTSLPPAALYILLFVMAALENIFPPLPADTVVAFGSFLAARGHASLALTALSTWTGNLTGAMAMYAVGRRFGAQRLHAWLDRRGESGAERRFAVLYGRYGTWALVVSRFLPGVRAVVPPVAGALRLPPQRALLAIGLASAVWYGAINVLAYRIGTSWDDLRTRLDLLGRNAAITAGLVLAAMLAIWLVRRRRRPSDTSAP